MWTLVQTDFKKMNKYVFLLPFVSCAFVLLFASLSIKYNPVDEFPWESYLLQMSTTCSIFLPISMTMICSHIANSEHRYNMWKQTFTFPLRKSGIYFAKLIECIIAEIAFFVSLMIGFIFIGFIFLETDVSLINLILKVFVSLFIAYIPIIAFQLWLSLIIKNQAFPISIGILLAIFSYTFYVFPFDIGRLLPWTFPSSVLPIQLVIDEAQNMSIIQTTNPAMYVGLSLIVGALIIFISMLHFTKRDIM
ncbi:ABC transporter permease [Siminovitchia terrae]|nr:ABC transporter permease [Siminovitchia terrae]GIN93683.1 ABC transporter permease [Siminovitchia terrae]GIN95904.1 ABC transporter permease [Siminovitchia terrae]